MYKRGVPGALIGMNRVTIVEDTQVTHRSQLPARYNTETELQEEVKAGPNEINFDLTTEEKK